MPTTTLYVRLKRYDQRRRHLMRQYFLGQCDIAPTGLRIEEKRGWYPVTEEVAEYLRKVRQIESDPDSPLAFDVATKAEAMAIDKREKAAADRAAGIVEPNDLTTADVAEGRSAAPEVPKAQRSIRRGVRAPHERSMRPVHEATS